MLECVIPIGNDIHMIFKNNLFLFNNYIKIISNDSYSLHREALHKPQTLYVVDRSEIKVLIRSFVKSWNDVRQLAVYLRS